MCKWGKHVVVKLTKSDYNDRSVANIDSCIAPLVQALNDAGIKTVASCCGHGKGLSNIVLGDRRELFISPNYEASRRLDDLIDNQIDDLIQKGD